MKNFVKKILCLVLCLLMVMAFTGCGATQSQDEQEEKTPRIAVMLPGTAAYFAAYVEGCDQAAKDYGVELTYFDAGWDPGTQAGQVQDACTTGYDVLVICSTDATAIIPSIDYANSVGIPVVASSNFVGEDTENLYEGVLAYVGQNETVTGGKGAEIAKKLLGEEGGNVVCIEGSAGTFCQIYRRQGFLEGIEGTNINVIFTQAADWDKGKAITIAEDVLQSNMDVDLFFCQDDNMAAGVGKTLEEYGVRDQYYVIGIGGSISGLQAMKDGLIDGDTFLSSVEEGYLSVEVAAQHALGMEFEKKTILEQVEVTPENVDTFEGEW